MAEPRPEVTLVEQGLCYLVAEHAAGCVVRAQVGGALCVSASITGFIVAAAAATQALRETMCDLGCRGRALQPEDQSRADRALRSLRWEVFNGVEELRIDPERIDACTEGWWRVRFRLRDPLRSGTTEHRGVVAGPNCD